MKHINYWLLTFGGLALILAGVLLAVDVQRAPALAQDDAAPAEEELEYIGADECQSCHRDLSRSHAESYHGRALIDVGRRKDDILANFELGEDVRTVQFPDEESPRAFTADDIEYVLGAGRYAQAYVYEVERGVYRVLPAKWNVTTQAWDAFTPADSWDDPAYDFVTQCAGCHTSGLDVERGRWLDDGVMCESCHGPASLHEEVASDAGRRPNDEELAAIRASINPGTDPQTCGACHSRGAVVEGATAFSTTYRAGDTLTDSYVPFGADDTMHWYATGHASHQNMQYNEWLISGHPNALTAIQENDYQEDSCLTCHSQDAQYISNLIARVEAGDRAGEPPTMPTVETAQFGVTCLSCHNPHYPAEGQDFNLIAEPYALCASCHSQETIGSTDHIHHPVLEMYEGRTLIENVAGVANPHFIDDGPNCLTCHMPTVTVDGNMERVSHSGAYIAPALAANTALVDTCSQCHSDLLTPDLLQAFIDDTQNGIRARTESLRAALESLPEDQRPTWAAQALDFVDGDGSGGIHNYAYADALLDAVALELGLNATAAAGSEE